MLARRRNTINPTGSDARNGAAMVECAILVPVLLLLILGMIEIGTALRAATIMSSSVREAGRLATMDMRGTTSEDETRNEKVMRDVKSVVTAAGLPGQSVVVTITHAEGPNEGQFFDLEDPDNHLKLLRLEAKLPYSALSVFPIRYMKDKTLRGEIVLRLGRSTISS